MALKITKREETGNFVSYHVSDEVPQPEGFGFECVLTGPRDDPAPAEFGLYIWLAPWGPDAYENLRPQRFREAVEVITGRKVREALENSGNGHGVVIVTYED